jgi:hypothetical protein
LDEIFLIHYQFHVTEVKNDIFHLQGYFHPFLNTRIHLDHYELKWAYYLNIVRYWTFYSRWIFISTPKLNTLQSNSISNSPNTAGKSFDCRSSRTPGNPRNVRGLQECHALTMSKIHFNR